MSDSIPDNAGVNAAIEDHLERVAEVATELRS